MLSKSLKSEFRENGVVVVESALSTEDLEPLREQHRQWIETSPQYDGPFGQMLDGRPRFDVEAPEIPAGASFFNQQAAV